MRGFFASLRMTSNGNGNGNGNNNGNGKSECGSFDYASCYGLYDHEWGWASADRLRLDDCRVRLGLVGDAIEDSVELFDRTQE
jgi:hypothetical protein